MMVGFEPTPEDWCLKPAPRVARGSLDHSATSSTCAIVTGFESALIGENQSCDPYGSRFQVYRLNHSATLSQVQTAVDRHGSRTRSLQIFQSVRYRADGVHVHPVGFEPTPPKRLGLKSNAFLARRERRKTNSATDTERPPRDQSQR